MKDFNQTKETLNRLSYLLTEIHIRESEVKNAIAYNKEWGCIGLEIDVKELQNQKKELQFEFNNLKRKL